MANKTYSELLKDPRWQKKRLQIMKRDKFACVECGDKESPLTVHHIIYIYGREPWEYENEELKTLCEACHESIHNDIQSLKTYAAMLSAENLHYAVDILYKMQFLYPSDCMDVLALTTELAEINKG